jgi:hypothetical protein
MMHASERPKSLADTNPGVSAPPELEALIFRALEKDRGKRYATAREFAQILDRLEPVLSEQHGAPPPLPSSAEVTNEATRVVRRGGDAATVVSISGDAPTIETVAPAAQKSLERVLHEPVEAPAAKSNRSGILAMAAIAIVGLLAAGWFFVQRRNADTRVVPQQAAIPSGSTPIQASTLVVGAPARLGINAFPWANVTSIRDLDRGEPVAIAENLQTPGTVELKPGRYEVTLSNPDYRKPIVRSVEVVAGRDVLLNVQFGDAGVAAVPDFGGSR